MIFILGVREPLEGEFFKVGEFRISQYGDSLLVLKDGESMEVSVDTLRRFWDENY